MQVYYASFTEETGNFDITKNIQGIWRTQFYHILNTVSANKRHRRLVNLSIGIKNRDAGKRFRERRVSCQGKEIAQKENVEEKRSF